MLDIFLTSELFIKDEIKQKGTSAFFKHLILLN